MASLSLSTPAKILPCPACAQTINTSMAQCPYCAAPLDAAAAGAYSAAFASRNQSISDASYLRFMFGCAMLFFLARALTGLATFGFLFPMVAVPFMTIRWWLRYGSIRSADPELAPPTA